MNFPTLIIRHRRENLKKCSLTGLERREDLRFFRYPEGMESLPDLIQYNLLAIDGEPLEPDGRGLLLVDATWRLAEKILKHPLLQKMPRRRIRGGFKTAYPRRQEDCSDKEAGLASIEALYLAHLQAGLSVDGLLDHYYWKKQFLEKNGFLRDVMKV